MRGACDKLAETGFRRCVKEMLNGFQAEGNCTAALIAATAPAAGTSQTRTVRQDRHRFSMLTGRNSGKVGRAAMCKEAKKVVVLKSAGFPQHGLLADEGRSHRVPRNGSEPNWRMQRPQRLQRSRRVICGMVEWQDLNLRPPDRAVLVSAFQGRPACAAGGGPHDGATREGRHRRGTGQPRHLRRASSRSAKIIEQAAEAEAKCEGRAR